MSFQNKYLKYKNKYLDLKKQMGGSANASLVADTSAAAADASQAVADYGYNNNKSPICSICTDKIKLEDMITLECRCSLHVDCFNSYLESTVGDSMGLVHIKCPSNPTHKDISFVYLQKLKALLSLNKEVIDTLIVRLKENIKELIRRKHFNRKGASDSFISASSHACPNCKFPLVRPHGHACHHVMGCPSCKVHFCFVCGSREAAHECSYNGHRLGSTWSSYCKKTITENDIDYSTGIPRDKRCGCSFCSDCSVGKPCADCKSGNCFVCKGNVKPGPLEILPESERIGWCIKPSSNTILEDDEDEDLDLDLDDIMAHEFEWLENDPHHNRTLWYGTSRDCQCCHGYINNCDCRNVRGLRECNNCEDPDPNLYVGRSINCQCCHGYKYNCNCTNIDGRGNCMSCAMNYIV
jgi:hypothetical protein